MLWAASVEAAIRENRHPPHLAGGKKIFAELVAKYTHTLIAHCKDGPARQMHLDWFKEYFVGLKPAEITPYRGAAARDALAAEKFKRNEKLNEDGTVQANAREFTRSGATVNRYLATLSHMLNMAKRESLLIDRNPVSDISKKKESRGRTRCLTHAERDRLLDACAKSDRPHLHALVMLATTTGAGRGELINLAWDAIGLTAGTALVTEKKNRERRQLILVGEALEIIRALKLRGSAKSDFVFPNPRGFPWAVRAFRPSLELRP